MEKFSLFSLEFARKSEAIFFFLDYYIPLRNCTGIRFHFILSERKVERLPSFRVIKSTAVEGCSYAEGAQGDSDAVSL